MSDRKSAFSACLPFLQNGGLMKGCFVTVGNALDVAPRTLARVWHSVLDNFESHLNNKVGAKDDETGIEFTVDDVCDIMLRVMGGDLPLKDFPDECFQTGKVGTVGQKRKDRVELKDRTVLLPLNQRSTFDGLAAGLDISIGLAYNLLKEEGSLLRSVQSSIKPSLTETQKWHRVEWVLSRIDTRTVEEENLRLRPRGHDWKFENHLDTVHVDESWFLQTEVSRCYILGKDEADPYRSTRHKSHIEKIMFLSAVARPRWDPGLKKNWDGKILCLPIGD